MEHTATVGALQMQMMLAVLVGGYAVAKLSALSRALMYLLFLYKPVHKAVHGTLAHLSAKTCAYFLYSIGSAAVVLQKIKQQLFLLGMIICHYTLQFENYSQILYTQSPLLSRVFY
jgi:hypothetical protein